MGSPIALDDFDFEILFSIIDSKLNILITTQSGNVSGATYSLLYLARGLKEKGHKIILAVPEGRLLHKLAVENGITFYPIRFRPKLSIKSIKAIDHLVRLEKIDIVNAQESRDRYSVILSKIIFGWKAKIILTRRQRVATNNFFKRWFHVRYSEKIIVISEGLQQLVKRKGFPLSHTHVIHNGLPIDQYVLSRETIEQLRSKYRLAVNEVVIGCVARPKRQDQMVNALKVLPKGWKMLFVGLSESAFKEKWPKIETDEIRDQLIFTGTIEDKSLVLHHYCLMNVHILPSQMDGFGLTSLEAMAMGVPVIGSNYGGIPDVIQHGENGFIFENDNIPQLAEQIKELVLHKQLRDRFIEKGFDSALNKFSIKKTVDNYEQFFLELLS